MVWNLCDGNNSIADISGQLSKKLKQPVTDDLVWLALDQLKEDNLLADNGQVEIKFDGLSRREVIRKVGLASLIAIPIITSIIAPSAVDAQSGCRAIGQGCSPGNSLGNCCRGVGFCSGGTLTCVACTPTGGTVSGCVSAAGCSSTSFKDACCSGSTTFTTTGCGGTPTNGSCTCA